MLLRCVMLFQRQVTSHINTTRLINSKIKLQCFRNLEFDAFLIHVCSIVHYLEPTKYLFNCSLLGTNKIFVQLFITWNQQNICSFVHYLEPTKYLFNCSLLGTNKIFIHLFITWNQQNICSIVHYLEPTK